MGSLVSLKKSKEGKVVVRLEMNPEEYSNLGGHVKDIYLFSEDAANVETRFSQRGTCDATKYFLIPKHLREGINFEEKVRCQRIEIPNKSIFVFVVNKKGSKA